MKGTVVLEKNLNEFKSDKRIIINEGGTGSSKTYSLAQFFAKLLTDNEDEGITISVVRKTMPALRATAMRNFFDTLKLLNSYFETNHNKSDNIYVYGKNQIEFFSVDEPMRIRSRRRDYLWINEANELRLEDYRQLSMRTNKKIFMDYNPSHFDHWIYDEVQTRKDCVVIRSTYLDNPFLPKEVAKEIESYKTKDKNYWRIYGLGLRGFAESLIFSHWQLCDNIPEDYDEKIYGLDFGFNNQTALVEITMHDKKYYWKELLYKRFLTNQELIGELNKLGINDKALIYADSAEPQRIEEIKRAGYNIKPSRKEKDSVTKGIDFIKSHDFYISKDSENILKEVKYYSWKVKDDKPIDEPVKVNDHLMDAGRYAIYTYYLDKPAKFPSQNKNQSEKGKPITRGLIGRRF